MRRKIFKLVGVIAIAVTLIVNMNLRIEKSEESASLLAFIGFNSANAEYGQHLYPCGTFYTCRWDDINRYCTNGSGSVCYCYCD